MYRIKKTPKINLWRFLFQQEANLFGVDDGFVDSVPASSIQTPVVSGVLVTLNSHFSSFYLFVSVDTHDSVC